MGGQNDATLSGTGTTGDVTVIDNGVLSPGEGGIGILYTSNLAFGPYSNPHFRVSVTADDSDQVDVEGTVDILGDVHLDIDSNLQVAGDEVLVLIKIDDYYGSITGTFFELEEGAVVLVGDAEYFITYRYNAEAWEPDTGNDVALWVPESMTAYRPQHSDPNNDYAPFARTAVADNEETSATLGPGIRINGDTDDGGEDDLIEVALWRYNTARDFRLRRSSTNIKVWTTNSMSAEITFPNDSGLETDDLSWVGNTLTVWVEWDGAGHGTAELSMKQSSNSIIHDRIKFHTFHTMVVTLGGENQDPTVPRVITTNDQGIFVLTDPLYAQGYDVHIWNEDAVAADGSGATFNEISNAVQNRDVTNIVIFGYSHGGGSVYDLADRLNNQSIGSIVFTSYIDAIENDSFFDTDSETRRPPGSAYHVNDWQPTPSLIFWPYYCNGAPTTGGNINREHPNLVHGTIDNDSGVHQAILSDFNNRMSSQNIAR